MSVIILAACQVAWSQQRDKNSSKYQRVMFRSLSRNGASVTGFTKVRVKAPASGQALLLVHAEVPLAHHVRGVARLLHQLRQQFLIQGHAVGLTGPDDLVLHARVNLQRAEQTDLRRKQSAWCRKLEHSRMYGALKEELKASVVKVVQTES